MENNIYKAPEAEISPEQENNAEQQLASRFSRLLAAIVDSIIMFAIIFPIAFLLGMYDAIASGSGEFSTLETIAFSILGLAVFAAINYNSLKENGQTLGKRALSIKIVALDGSKAEMGEHIIKRYLTYMVPSQIPVIGGIWSFINIIFIFGKDRMCIHDHVAKTKVINDNEE